MLNKNLKEIIYRGGVVRFRIPEHWIEEYDDYEGGTFYDDAEGSGTFRLSLLTLNTPPAEDSTSFTRRLVLAASQPGRALKIHLLTNDNSLVSFTNSAFEEGNELLIYHWLLGHLIPPNHARLAQFSFTILLSQTNKPEFIEQVALLEREISLAEFAPSLGIVE